MYLNTQTFLCFNDFLKIIGFIVLATGVYILVDPKFIHIKNIANSDVKEFAGNFY